MRITFISSLSAEPVFENLLTTLTSADLLSRTPHPEMEEEKEGKNNKFIL